MAIGLSASGGMPRQGILSLAIKDKGALYNAYMPYLKHGGIFVPTAKRYFLGDEASLPPACPQCGGELRHRCPACEAPIASAFAVECEECGAHVRDAELFGTTIRRPGK